MMMIMMRSIACVAGARKGKGEGKSGAGKGKVVPAARPLFISSFSFASERKKSPLVRF